jgi:pyruvate formate lyase activating enzyme
MDSDRHRRFTGVPNERILGNLSLLAAEGRPVIVRLPLIPGVNDDEGNIRATGAFIASLGLVRVDLLPYHRAGTARYERLERPYALAGVAPPAPEDVTKAIRWLEAHGLEARPGGSS